MPPDTDSIDWSEKKIFTTGEAAKVCKVSQQTIIRCFDSGRLSGFRVPGSRFRRIPRAELIRFMRKNDIPLDAIETDIRRVLVVDEDWDTLDLLARILREQGHQVALATDGQSGLKRAVEIAAEVVLVDRNVTILDIRTFLDVLTDNPRTADAHVFVLGRGDRSELGALHARAEPIVKPFHAEEVAARVLDVIRARREPARAAELEGDLQQVALFQKRVRIV